MAKLKPQRSFMAKLVVRIPYAWLVAFFLVPFLIVLKISLSQTAIAQPPYTPVFDLAAGWHGHCEFLLPACRSTITPSSAPIRFTFCPM